MKQLTTVCTRDCYDTCALLLERDDSGKIISLKGDPQHPYTQGFLCPRGAKDRERLGANRVERPFIRRGGILNPLEWNESLRLISQQLKATLAQEGPQAALFLNYAGNTGLLTSTFVKRLWYALGATQTDNALCSKSGHKALALHYGESYGFDPLELPEKDFIVFWGFNAAVSAPHLWALARQARKNRATPIVVIDPRKSKSAQQADIWIQPHPGSDVALAYGIMRVLIRQQQIDHEFIRKWTKGFDELRAEILQWTPQRVERATGVSQRQIEQLATAYAHSAESATMLGIGLQKSDHGADQIRAAAYIPSLLGQHRGFFYSNSAAFSIDDDIISGKTLTQKRSPVVSQVGLADSVQRGDFKFIFISGMNPALTLPNQHAFRAGLTRDDVFVVVHDTHWSKTTEFADVVLPAPTYFEKDDLTLPWTHNRVRISPQVIAPVSDSRTEVYVMQALARSLEQKEAWLYADPWDSVRAALADAFETGNLDDLRAGKELKLKRKPPHQYATPSGKIEFASSQAVSTGFSALPQQEVRQREPQTFVYLTSATPHYTSTQFQEIYGPIPAVAQINPRDAAHLGIEEGDNVTLANEHGEMTVTAIVSEDVPQGVLWSPRQSEDLNGIPQNSLTSSLPQAIGKGPRFHSTYVRLTGSGTARKTGAA